VQVEEHGPEGPIRLVGKQVEFLDAMEGRARDVYRRDMEANLRAMRGVEGGYGDVEAWDVPFYTNMIKVQRQHRRWREEWDAMPPAPSTGMIPTMPHNSRGFSP